MHHDEQDICPLSGLHRRMDDAHRLWHLAQDAYFEPDAFRVALQNCIQTLRSVTFVLKKEQSLIPDFDTWYPKWQDGLKRDRVMKWLVTARNKIEKQGDLNAFSFVHARIIASYLDEVPDIDISVGLSEGVERLLRKIPRLALEKQVLEYGVLQIERRWVDEELPDYELFDALGYAYGRLSIIVDDTHRQCGMPVPVLSEFQSDGQNF